MLIMEPYQIRISLCDDAGALDGVVCEYGPMPVIRYHDSMREGERDL